MPAKAKTSKKASKKKARKPRVPTVSASPMVTVRNGPSIGGYGPISCEITSKTSARLQNVGCYGNYTLTRETVKKLIAFFTLVDEAMDYKYELVKPKKKKEEKKA